ncbi:HsdM family class I SAM-dependent methyltransferase [Lactococcus lactis]|uniref:HsdM family class I SAM-dependent methyltransferase n=1 Tax=Lactococcus lactis TaxID=1358 RepID=UPI001CA33955|nr:N-6 DNA methylase [Lactococcus lactis]
MKTFLEAKNQFDKQNSASIIFKAFLPDHLTYNKEVSIKNSGGQPNEQYYKWQFLYGLVYSGLINKDYIGTEVQFPKGNKNSASIKLDGAIFDDKNWFDYYQKFVKFNDLESLEWLREHLVVAIEIKKEDSKNISDVWDKQLKAYMKESSRDVCLGMLYDTERLYLFKKDINSFVRYSDEYNLKGSKSKTAELSLHIPDPYYNIPSFDYILNNLHTNVGDRSKRNVWDLDTISGVQSIQINNSMSSILKIMDRVGLVNQKGFEILIQILTLKIYDEKRSEEKRSKYLDFYISQEEKQYKELFEKDIQEFINRFDKLRKDASEDYFRIFKDNELDLKENSHIKVLIEIVEQFQDYSFVRSHKTDLYQLVFYQFAAPFAKEQNAQFVTPLPLIDFLVKIVNPRKDETVIDPTVGIADFLSVSYVNSESKLDDNNIFGMDIDEQMVMLATLNMLLNGDGNAKIISKAGYGSLLSKFDTQGSTLELIPSMNKSGNWENRSDNKRLKKFDVVLTNPPFGDNRAFKPSDSSDFETVECYEMWDIYNPSQSRKGAAKIDMGILFLENAYRILKEKGRMGIVLSNSIASIDSHKAAREWLMKKMRIVAIFDLPSNVFAETGVNTSIIVAYKPSEKELEKLKNLDYEVFFKPIKKLVTKW